MNLEKLLAQGAVICGGQVDMDNVNIGFVSADGDFVVTPEGAARLARMKAGIAEQTPSGARAARRRAAAAAEDAVVTKETSGE